MEGHLLVELIIFATLFLVGIAFVTPLTKKLAFPYTVALLFAGFIAQFFTHNFSVESHIILSPDVIFYVLLPILLFEGAFHINFHQFRLQFKTITAFATIGLLISIFVVAFGLSYLVGFDFGASLLFGAIISATDPIAVLALFKHLGGPKRLALLADGESMFNDATGVVAFRVISAFIIAGNAFTTQAVLSGFGSFIYIFIGSIILGLVLGYITSIFIAKIENEPLIESTLTVALALGSFIIAEHYFHLSGVISTVMAGITLSHVGRTRISRQVIHFIEELWGFLGFIAVSMVFFFAAYNLDVNIFTNNLPLIGAAIIMVLAARAISIYGTAILTNKLPFFKDEPNVPMSWLHILNWGGLRGVIPLVLVYSLPETYEYREEMLAFTLGALLFTLIINGLTIKTLLLKLGLNKPSKEEEIVELEVALFETEKRIEDLKNLNNEEFDKKTISMYVEELQQNIKDHKKELAKLGTSENILNSIKLQALQIQRDVIEELFEKGYLNENAYYEYDSQLDLQQDAIEYPRTFGHSYGKERLGVVSSRISYRKRLKTIRKVMSTLPILENILKISEEDVILERFSLIKSRIIANNEVIEFLERNKVIFGKNKELKKSVIEVEKIYRNFLKENHKELSSIQNKHPQIVNHYQENLLSQLV